MNEIKDAHCDILKPKLFVPIQRLIECPGCSRVYQSTERCAQHLLENCLRIRRGKSDDFRIKTVKWILNLLRNCTCVCTRCSLPGAYKINMIMNDATIDPSQKVRMTVKLPKIPENMRCPVCKKFFSTRRACEDHVFGDCLYFELSEFDELSAIDAKIWLTRIFTTNGKDYSNFINEMYEKWSIIVCKYCDEKFAGQNNLMRHFRSSHSDMPNVDGALCFVCNYSALHDQKLGKHLIAKHLKCGCGLTKFKNFDSLKSHAKSCKENEDDFVRCPICRTMVSPNSENSLIDHLAKCKPIFETMDFDDSGLFFDCDICLRSVLISNIDCHLTRHVSRRDVPRRRQKRVRVSLDKIKNYVNSHEFKVLEKLCSKTI